MERDLPSRWHSGKPVPGGPLSNGIQRSAVCVPPRDRLSFRKHRSLVFRASSGEEMTLSLRIPAWAEHTEVRIGSEMFYPAAGTYCEMRGRWRKYTEIQIDFHTELRIVTAPGSTNEKALMWGSLVLAMDRRDVEEAPKSLWLMNDAMKPIHDKQMDLDYYPGAVHRRRNLRVRLQNASKTRMRWSPSG